MCRFIPTHVGNSRVNLLKKMLVTVHPHACGELERMMKKLSICVGSSPRMWGTQVCRAAHRGRQRFIPTHVGNSPTGTGPLPRRPVHPHACGELGVARHPAVELLGSSPRMWGTLEVRREREPPRRFIPTHVGNSSCSGSGRSGRTVHPHACGELWSHVPGFGAVIGSSPRMWGTPLGGWRAHLIDRFIPTHVGNSGRGPTLPAPRAVHPHACGELSSYYYSEKEKSFYPPAGYCHTWDRPPELPWAPA